MIKEIKKQNTAEKVEDAMAELIAALELCLQCEGLTWEAEHDAEIVVSRAKRLLK